MCIRQIAQSRKVIHRGRMRRWCSKGEAVALKSTIVRMNPEPKKGRRKGRVWVKSGENYRYECDLFHYARVSPLCPRNVPTLSPLGYGPFSLVGAGNLPFVPTVPTLLAGIAGCRGRSARQGRKKTARLSHGAAWNVGLVGSLRGLVG